MTQQGKTTSDATNKEELRGTFFSVLIIGAFILLFWIVMFYIYMKR
ncbi:cytochrome c oxidase subunit 2A [Bacillaceae bacterium C204]